MLVALAKDYGSVWHGTTLQSLVSILDTDTFRLSQVAGKQAEAAYAKTPFFLSVRRQPVKLGSNYAVTLELKEQLLHSRMRRMSVDYWQLQGHKASEQEDRYFNAKPNLDRATSLIRAIYVNKDHVTQTIHAKHLRRAFITAKAKGINIYLLSGTDYERLNKRGALPFTDVDYGPSVQNNPPTQDDIAYNQRKVRSDYKRSVEANTLLMYRALINRLRPEDAEHYMAKRLTNDYAYEHVSYAENELHNASHSRLPADRKYAAMLQYEMAKRRISLSEAVAIMRDNLKALRGLQ